jgi:hypothetical protein
MAGLTWCFVRIRVGYGAWTRLGCILMLTPMYGAHFAPSVVPRPVGQEL